MNAHQRRVAIRRAYPGMSTAEARYEDALDRIHAAGGCVCMRWDCPICGCVPPADADICIDCGEMEQDCLCDPDEEFWAEGDIDEDGDPIATAGQGW